MTEGLAAGAPQVLDLLNYIEQVEKLKSKPAFSVPTEFFVAYQHELKGLPELQFNLQVEGDDVWLRLPRLQEIAAPEPDEILRPWIVLPKSPEKTPELKGEIIIVEGKREVARERIEDRPEVRDLPPERAQDRLIIVAVLYLGNIGRVEGPDQVGNGLGGKR